MLRAQESSVERQNKQVLSTEDHSLSFGETMYLALTTLSNRFELSSMSIETCLIPIYQIQPTHFQPPTTCTNIFTQVNDAYSLFTFRGKKR